jgi:dCTP deaminase
LTFWSGNKIEQRFVEEPKIVDPYDVSRIDCSAYTMTLGEQYFITPDHDMKMRDSVRRTLAEPTASNHAPFFCRKGGGPVSVPAGQFAFLQTEEYLSMPDNTMGFISMKAGYKFKGLVNVSGFHVDPGFRGKLVFAVYNAGPSAVTLHRGDQLFLLWLADLDEAATAARSRKNKPPMLEISNDIINGVNHPIHSLQNLSKKIDEIEREHKFFKFAVYLIAAFITASIGVGGFLLNANRSLPLTAGTASQAEASIDAKPTKAEALSSAKPKG